MLTTTAEFTNLLASAPRVWFVADGWRFQARYQPDFILTVLDQMELVHNERGVMVFRGEGYALLPEPAVQRQRRADFGDELALTGFGLSSTQLHPGDELQITLDWQGLALAGPAYTAFLHLVTPEGVGVAGVDEPVLHGLYQPDLWPRDQTLPDRHTLSLPPNLPSGRYRLDVGLYPSDQPGALLPVVDSDHLPLAMLAVGEATTPSPPAQETDVVFGDQIRLLGYDLECSAQSRACSLQLHWQAVAAMERDYTVFVHVVDASGEFATQDDHPPGDPFFPTSTWLPGEIVLDQHTLTPTGQTPPGEYTIVVGIYHQPSDERLPVADAAGKALGDALPLATINLGSESP
jgi:hypothetical protein